MNMMSTFRGMNVNSGALQRAALFGQPMDRLDVVVVYHSDLGAGVPGLRLSLTVSVIDDGLLLARLNDQRRPFTWRKLARRWRWCLR